MTFKPPRKTPIHHIIWPPPLKPGDLLAVVAPASPVAPDLFAAGAAILETWGFRLSYGPEIFAPRPYHPAADLNAWQFFRRALIAPDVSGVICARGGYGTLRILEHLDYSLLASHPRVPHRLQRYHQSSLPFLPTRRPCHLSRSHRGASG